MTTDLTPDRLELIKAEIEDRPDLKGAYLWVQQEMRAHPVVSYFPDDGGPASQGRSSRNAYVADVVHVGSGLTLSDVEWLVSEVERLREGKDVLGNRAQGN